MNRWKTALLTLALAFTLAACSTGGTGDTVSAVSVESTAAATAAASAAEAQAENQAVHGQTGDTEWDSANAVAITLDGGTISADGPGVTVDGSTAMINAAGTYVLSGTLDDGQIVVNTDSDAPVKLVLNGASLSSSTSAPISIEKAEEVVVLLAEGSSNTLGDAAEYVYASAEVSEPNAALFSAADLTISGGGSLTVTGNANDGIAVKDGLLISGGTITVNAVDDGIRGKDYIVVQGGAITVTAQGNGLMADNEEDAERGYISIEGGSLNVTSGGDAVQAATDVMVTGGEVSVSAGGGSTASLAADASAKGIKASVSINIDGGTFNIDSADDALHTNGTLTVNGGTFTLASGDDGMHADASLTINNGDVNIIRSYEGLESAVITVNAGTIHLVSSDDGFNVAAGNDGSGAQPGMGGPRQDTFAANSSNILTIHGGTIVVNAGGDGLDSNGSIEITAGTVLVHGPTEQMNGSIDYNGTFKMSGGTLVAAGSAGMAEGPDESSTQASMLVAFNGTLPGGTLVHIVNSAGEEILTFAPLKDFQSLAFSSPALVQGETYTISTGGSSSGTSADGLIQGGSTSGGTTFSELTLSGMVTRLGTFAGPGGGMRKRP